MTSENEDQLTRESVYRYILASLQGDQEKTALLEIGLYWLCPAICSPRVSRAISTYLEVKNMPAAKLTEQQLKLQREGKLFANFFSLLGSWVKENITYHREVPKAFDGVVDAMCWELETTREKFLGAGDQ